MILPVGLNNHLKGMRKRLVMDDLHAEDARARGLEVCRRKCTYSGLMSIRCLALKMTDPHNKTTKFCKKFLISTTYMACIWDLIIINPSLFNCVVTERVLLQILSAKHAKHLIPMRP